ncbi:DUF308 domain-containing protein [Anaerovorax odorimutans]|uniref:DUF308 domain-containing protein n=1 Tax=Anaerovorax odorimutans TaxID=109327 RepID=A0ABT1RQ83_9FIRM|nr:DUF308 domain-containing protein [Anaerovorax odorimutans]MCQ4637354.1 DUF308 domain-containing protein [Anaerovorax odorimutans]
MDGIKKIKSLGIFLGILLILLGVVFIVFRRDIVEVLAMIVGICIIVIGAFKTIQALTSKSEVNNKPMGVSVGIVLLALGIFILVNTNISIMMLGVVIGIFAFASAFDRFAVARERKRRGFKCGNTVLFGLVHILFGILMIYCSFAMMSFIVVLTGIYLLAAGIMVVLSTGYFFDYK